MVKEYIFLAAGCVSVGILTTFIVLGMTVRLGISIEENWWLVAIPAVFSLILNVTLLELLPQGAEEEGMRHYCATLSSPTILFHVDVCWELSSLGVLP
ncbi:MAG: hypothetical protein HYX80_00940 [Chloroflexi bacterium]|nr:hypothetical protein [Chloroflexota bacterium]